MGWTLRSEHCPTLLIPVSDSYDHHAISDIQASGMYHQKTCKMNIRKIKVRGENKQFGCRVYQLPNCQQVRATGYGLYGTRIESRWEEEIFRTCPDRLWVLPSLLYNGYRVFPGVKRPGRGVDHPPKLAYSYTSTPPMGLRGLFQGELYLYLYLLEFVFQLAGRRYLRLQGIQ